MRINFYLYLFGYDRFYRWLLLECIYNLLLLNCLLKPLLKLRDGFASVIAFFYH